MADANDLVVNEVDEVDDKEEPIKRPASIKSGFLKKAKSKAKSKAKAVAKKPSKGKKNDDDKKKDNDNQQDEETKPAKGTPKAKAKAKANAKPKPKPAPKKAAPVRELKRRLMESADKAFDQETAQDVDAEDDDEQDEPGEETADKRDRCKKQKFDALMKAGKLPTHIIQQYEEGMKTNSQKRNFKTQFVNTLFERDAKGKLVMTPNAPMFQAWKETSTRLNFHDKQTGLPKRVFMGKYFANSEQALNDAIAAEEVQVMKYDGQEWFVFRTLKLDQIQGKLHEQMLLQSEKGLDKNGCKQMMEAFDSVNFDFSKYMINKPSITSSSSSSNQLAIADAPKGVMHKVNIISNLKVVSWNTMHFHAH
jgi:hypothetical protein